MAILMTQLTAPQSSKEAVISMTNQSKKKHHKKPIKKFNKKARLPPNTLFTRATDRAVIGVTLESD